MKAVGFTHARPIEAEDSLIDVNIPDPTPRRRDLLVEVKAISVNPVDTKLRRNAEPLGELRILGFDAAGIVRAVGPDVTHFGIGDEVFYAGAISRQGTNAELHLVDDRIVGRKPKTLGFAEAASVPLTALTAWEMLFDRFRIPRDRSLGGDILIVGGAGGVGSMAVQLAAALTGLTVIATASRPETREWVNSLGAHHVVDHTHDLAPQLAAIGHPHPGHIFCTTQLDTHWRTLVHLLAPEGDIGAIESGKPLETGELMQKSASLHMELMFTRPERQTPTIEHQHRTLSAVAGLLDRGVIRHTMREHFGTINAVNLKRAHAAIGTGRTIGKIVLEGF